MKSYNISKRIIVSIIICTLLMCQCILPVYGDEQESGVRTLHTHYYSATTNSYHVLEVEFDPDWFKEDARVYDHNLAKLSMGLTMAAFRPDIKHLEGISSMDMNLYNFLAEADFKDIRSDDYDKNPNIYSVSTAMGHQRIGEGDEAFELIAVGVCGQGYIDEWESNFSIGEGAVHDGFQRSSDLVFDRIFGYIASLHLEGPFKIWISGFSRAAAISNCTAAMLSDSNTFTQSTVFAYTFATPRVAIDPDYNRYENIWNIVGKTDPVPCVPYAEWGFERYGQTLFLPSLETDSNYEELRTEADKIYKDLTGIDFWYNRETNRLLKTILGYLLELSPTSKVYYQSLQNRIIRIWEDKSPINILSNLLEIAKDPVLINEDTEYEAGELLNYLLALVREYREGNSVFKRWNNKTSTGVNLAHFHTPEQYVSWLFSTDEVEKLYNPYTKYSEIYLISSCDVELFRDGKLIESLPSMLICTGEPGDYHFEEKQVSEKIDTRDLKYLDYTDSQIIAGIPRDEDYEINVKTDEETSFTLYEMDYEAGHQKPYLLTVIVYTMPENSDLTISFTGQNSGDQIDQNTSFAFEKPMETIVTSSQAINEEMYFFETIDSDIDVSSAVLISKRNTNRLNWAQAVMLTISAALFLIALIFFDLTYIIGRIRFSSRKKRGMIPQNDKYRGLPTLCVYSIFLLFLIMEFYAQLLPYNKGILLIFKLVIGLISVFIAYYGYIRNKAKLSLWIMIGLASLTVADVSMSINAMVGPIFHIIAYLVLAYAYYKDEKPEKLQVIISSLISLIAIGFIMSIKGEYGILRVYAIVYLVSVGMVLSGSMNQSRVVLIGSILLALSGLLFMYNTINGTTFVSHIISLGTYYAAVAVLASSTIRKQMYRYIPVPIQVFDQES